MPESSRPIRTGNIDLANPLVARASAIGASELYAARLGEHLAGRRTLERPDQSSEPEPATLAQLASLPRIDRALRQLRERHHPAAAVAERMAHTIVSSFVSDAAHNPNLHVATWATAERSLAALGDLLEALTNALHERGEPCA